MQAVGYLADKLGIVGASAGQRIDAAVVDDQTRIAVLDDQLLERHQLVVQKARIRQQVVDEIRAYGFALDIGHDGHGIAGVRWRLTVKAAVAAQVASPAWATLVTLAPCGSWAFNPRSIVTEGTEGVVCTTMKFLGT